MHFVYWKSCTFLFSVGVGQGNCYLGNCCEEIEVGEIVGEIDEEIDVWEIVVGEINVWKNFGEIVVGEIVGEIDGEIVVGDIVGEIDREIVVWEIVVGEIDVWKNVGIVVGKLMKKLMFGKLLSGK